MDLAPERREKLSGSDVPISVVPSPLLPSREILQDPRVFRIVKMIVADPRRNESALALLSALKRNDKLLPILGVPNAARIRGGVNARAPARFRRARASRNVLVLPAR